MISQILSHFKKLCFIDLLVLQNDGGNKLICNVFYTLVFLYFSSPASIIQSCFVLNRITCQCGVVHLRLYFSHSRPAEDQVIFIMSSYVKLYTGKRVGFFILTALIIVHAPLSLLASQPANILDDL